jgi:serine phosphatase RsbU (regulator of sigma subunit)
LFSDGFADQFGEVSGKKLKYSRFREMILSLDGNTMEEQRQMLVVMLENWKGNLEQVDDICVIGVKI